MNRKSRFFEGTVLTLSQEPHAKVMEPREAKKRKSCSSDDAFMSGVDERNPRLICHCGSLTCRGVLIW